MFEVRDCSTTLTGSGASAVWQLKAGSTDHPGHENKYTLLLAALSKTAPTDSSGLLVDVGSGVQSVLPLLADKFPELLYVPVDLTEHVPGSGTRICNLNEWEFPFFRGDNVTAFFLSGVMEYVVDKLTVLRMCRQHPDAVVVMHYITGTHPLRQGAPHQWYKWVAQMDVLSITQLASLAGFDLRVFKPSGPAALHLEELDVPTAEDYVAEQHQGLVFLFNPITKQHGQGWASRVQSSIADGPQPTGSVRGTMTDGPRLPKDPRRAGVVHAVWALEKEVPAGLLRELVAWHARSFPPGSGWRADEVTVHCVHARRCLSATEAGEARVTKASLDVRAAIVSGQLTDAAIALDSWDLDKIQASPAMRSIATLAVMAANPGAVVVDLSVFDAAACSRLVATSLMPRLHETWVGVVDGSGVSCGAGPWSVWAATINKASVAFFIFPLIRSLSRSLGPAGGGGTPAAEAAERYVALQRARSNAHSMGQRVRLLASTV